MLNTVIASFVVLASCCHSGAACCAKKSACCTTKAMASHAQLVSNKSTKKNCCGSGSCCGTGSACCAKMSAAKRA